MFRRALAVILGSWLVLSFAACAGTGYAAGGVVVVKGSHAFAAIIKGRVVNGGLGIPGARVTVAGYGQSSITDRNGYFYIRFRASAPARVHRLNVNLNVSKPGFRNRTVGISVREGATTTTRISLAAHRVILVR